MTQSRTFASTVISHSINESVMAMRDITVFRENSSLHKIYFRFYDAMPGNAWLINATAYGHGDALEQFFVDAIGVSQQSNINNLTLLFKFLCKTGI